ncbi:hypothetical protein D9757_002078 [Collybiopsis confluens]|uniref:Chromatin assembly factor 1 subunit A dimerization domain-containing protein n=1 Tax=Collybiopsis confluens TaxID=2823264 RepID=A0A8H5MEV7_9AGAR|nr:hypothetical protein D9757_002078 [Collybiopsis confluens]
MPSSPSNKANDSDSPAKSSLVELKNGKFVFKQKPYSFEKHSETLQALVKFREMLQDRMNNQSPVLSALDDEDKPLIAKLVHERRVHLILASLAKHVHAQLLPSESDDDGSDASPSAFLPISIVETAIQEVALRNNYGIETDLGIKAPAATCVWRWEVKEEFRSWLPKNMREKVASRLADRVKAKNELMTIFASLPEDERHSIIHTRTSIKVKDEKKGKTATSTKPSQNPVPDLLHVAESSANGEAEDKIEQPKSKPGRLRRETEKMSKVKKPSDAQKSLMAHFFTKPKAGSIPMNKPFSSTTVGPSTTSSDFERTFKPYVLKKGARLAPINAFLERESKTTASGTSDDIIIIDEEEPKASTSTEMVIANLTTQERLFQILSSMPKPITGKLKRPPRSAVHGMKTYYPIVVQDLLKQLSEVELFGDATAVRKIHQQLSNRDLLPAKVLIFSENSRPGYYGTWTRSSRLIGPRTPYVKDVLEIDYGYDSGEDWEAEPVGDADDVQDDGDDEEGTEDCDSDIDDWLVDDDEVEEGLSLQERADSPNLPSILPKRKTEDPGTKPLKKRKVVVPLVPFTKETPFPINPFTFLSATSEEQKPTKATQQGFVVPALPSHAIHPSPVANVPAKAVFGPKTAFPDEHLPILLSKINITQAANLTVLVEAVSQELRQHKVKKNAIEAKIREVGERCKVRKFWVVKENYPLNIDTT